MMKHPDESFRKTESAYENDMGISEGCEEFVCPYCESKYSLRYREESGGGEYIDDPWCPECGWPVPEEEDDFSHCVKLENEDVKAPCPICDKMSFIVIHIECQCVQLSCGHWVGEDFFEYAEAYKEMIKFLGLKGTGKHDSFIRKHPEAGKDKLSNFGNWMDELAKLLRFRFGIGTEDIDEESLYKDFERGETPERVTDYLKENNGFIEFSSQPCDCCGSHFAGSRYRFSITTYTLRKNTMKYFVKVHGYRFDTSIPEEKIQYQNLVSKLKKRNLILSNVLDIDYRKSEKFREKLLAYEKLEIDTKYLFDNQYNTTENSGNLRIFEWCENLVQNKCIKKGYYLDIPPELRKLQVDTYKCGFCGKQAIKPEYDMCPHCKKSKWLSPSENYLRKMKPIRKLGE